MTDVQNYQLIFWDFDGTIKDSVSVKSDAFEQLFAPYGADVAKRVRKHHEKNGGVSRYKKIPIYLEWAGLGLTDCKIDEFCAQFSHLTLQGVINSPWVDGAKEYLSSYHNQQYFVLITATPQNEIEKILEQLKLTPFFREVYGAPIEKSVVINTVMQRLKIEKEKVLVVGDAETDFNAAKDNRVSFLLRATELNKDIQKKASIFQCKDFS